MHVRLEDGGFFYGLYCRNKGGKRLENWVHKANPKFIIVSVSISNIDYNDGLQNIYLELSSNVFI